MDEIVRGWRILAGCILGIAVGVIALPSAALAIFMPGFQAEFGWSRTVVSLGGTVLVAALVLTSPLVGWLADRTSEARLAVASLLAMACAFLLFSRMQGDIRVFLIGFGAMALVSSGASTIPFARIISLHFSRSRGLALGLAMMGTGLTGILVPLMLVPFAAAHGWRSGFLVLAAVVIAATPIVALLLRGTSRVRRRSSKCDVTVLEGVPFAEAARSRNFAILALSFSLISLAAAGLAIHFVSLLADAGLSPARAGALASLTGLATIVARVGTGWLIDRLFAPWVAAAMMATAAACMLVLGMVGAAAAPLGAIAYGLAIGSEIDLIAYLAARYFGMRAYGRIYGALYAAVLVGSALSPIGYGVALDLTGNYQIALFFAAALLVLAAGLLATLPRFSTHLSTHSSPINRPVMRSSSITEYVEHI
jgi:MFS family permease